MGIKRVIDRSFWTDDKVLDKFSPEDRLFMLYLLTCPDSTQLGIFKLNPRVAAFHLGYSTETVKVLLDRFESKYGIIKYSHKTNEIAVKNYLCYSIVKGGKPVYDLLIKELNAVQDTTLIGFVFNNLKSKRDLNNTVREIVNSYTVPCENENENGNDNDNDNDVSYHESWTIRPRFVHDSSEVVVVNAFEFWNQNMGMLNQYIGEQLQALVDEYSEPVVVEAMKIAVKQGKRTLAYVEGCCKNIAAGTSLPKKQGKGNNRDLKDVAAEVEAILAKGGMSDDDDREFDRAVWGAWTEK